MSVDRASGHSAGGRPRSVGVRGAQRPPSVSLVDGRQIDVGQYRRDDAALRGTRDGVADGAFDQDAGFQKGEHEPQDLAVLDAVSHPLHQQVMVDGVEATLDVAFDHIAVSDGAACVRMQLTLDFRQRVMGASTAPEAIRGRIEVRLEDWLQHELQSHLYQAIFERGNPQWPNLAWLARLRDKPLSHGFGTIGAAAKLSRDLFEEACHAAGTLFDLITRDAVCAGSLAALVAGELHPSRDERSVIAYEIEQIRKSLFGIGVTPPIQFALHVGDEPGIHRAGHASSPCRPSVPTIPLRRVDGFPALRLLRGLRPSASRSSVASIIFVQKHEEATPRFSGSVTDLSSALGADFTPCGLWPLNPAGSPKGWRTARRTPPIRKSPVRISAPPALRPTCPLPRWQVPCSTEASAIGSVSLSISDSQAKPITGAEVPVCPALVGSADVRRPGCTRFASPTCSALRTASRKVRGLSSREVTDSFVMNDSFPSPTT